MFAAFFFGGVFALATGAVLVIIALTLDISVRVSLPAIAILFVSGGIVGLIARPILRRRFTRSASAAPAASASRDIRLPLFDPSIGGVAGLPPPLRVLTHLVRGDASLADLSILFRSPDQARATFRDLLARGDIELSTPDGLRIPPPDIEALLRPEAHALERSRVLVQITDAGTARLAEAGT